MTDAKLAAQPLVIPPPMSTLKHGTLVLTGAVALLLLTSCGGNSSSSPPLPPTAALARVEIAQTLIQSSDDPRLAIAQQKPFVVRAFFTVPEHRSAPSNFSVTLSTTQHPNPVTMPLKCPSAFPATFPADPSPEETASASGVCELMLSQTQDGSWWSTPGLVLTFHATDSLQKDVMAPVTKRLGNAVLSKNLTIPLCPRIIVDAQGAALDGAAVGSVADLNAAVLAYFPFSAVKYCPDAFTSLPVTTLSGHGNASIASKTQLQLEADSRLVLNALEEYRAARQDGYSGYIHVGLLQSSAIFVNPPSSDQSYRGTHGVTQHIGGLTIALFVPPSFTQGPIDYFQYHLIFLHELGHALGLAHAPGCGAASYDPDYPYADGVLPQDAADPAVTPIVASPGIAPTVPLRGTLGKTNGYQLQPLSNSLSVPYPGPAARNAPGTTYRAGIQQVIGTGANEIPISSFQLADLDKTQVYDLMNYCSVYFYNKWISDYSYLRIAAYSLERLQADGSFTDLSGQVTFGAAPAPDNIE